MRSVDLAAVAQARELATTGELRRRRIALGIKNSELAGQLDKTPATLSRWESGDRTPNARDAVRWMRLIIRLEVAAAGVARVSGGVA